MIVENEAFAPVLPPPTAGESPQEPMPPPIAIHPGYAWQGPMIFVPAPEPPPAPAPVPPPPAPSPAPACSGETHVVFFGFDRTNIDDAATAILKNAVAANIRCSTPRVRISGHADRAGPAAYNMALSARRSQAIFDYLVTIGISATAIDREAMGESRPMVETADGVRDMQNRRVEITFEPPIAIAPSIQ